MSSLSTWLLVPRFTKKFGISNVHVRGGRGIGFMLSIHDYRADCAPRRDVDHHAGHSGRTFNDRRCRR
jgi:hypothetical protein